jgi:hypothetical protein
MRSVDSLPQNRGHLPTSGGGEPGQLFQVLLPGSLSKILGGSPNEDGTIDFSSVFDQLGWNGWTSVLVSALAVGHLYIL